MRLGPGKEITISDRSGVEDVEPRKGAARPSQTRTEGGIVTTVLADLLAWSWLIGLAVTWLLTPTGTRGPGRNQEAPPVGANVEAPGCAERRAPSRPLNAALANTRPSEGPLLPEHGGPPS